MQLFGKSRNTSLNQALSLHPAVKNGQDVIFASPYIIVSRDSTGKILTVWSNSENNQILTRFVSDEPQEFIGLTKTVLAANPNSMETVFLTLTPTQIHAYVLSPNRPAVNVDKEISFGLMRQTSFGSIEEFTQSKEHPSLFLIKSHQFFKRKFYTFDLITLTLVEHNNESDLPK